MRQIIIVFLSYAVFASAKPISVDGNATITDPENLMPNMKEDGSWSYGYKTSNNIEVHHESADNNDIQRGEYSYIDPDGRLIQVIWMAGAGIGFVPQSNVIDEAIIQSIELNLQNPPEGHDEEDGKKAAPKKPTPPLNKVTFDKAEHKKVDRPAKAVETTKKYNEISRKEGVRQLAPEVQEVPKKKVEEPKTIVEDIVEEAVEADEVSTPSESAE